MPTQDRVPTKPLTRNRISSISLLILTALFIIACIAVTAPFVPALSWALALAVVAHPVHGWMSRRVRKPDLAAGLSVAVIVIGLLAPTVLVIQQVGRQASSGFKDVQEKLESGEFEQKLQSSPRLAGIYGWVKNFVDVDQELKGVGEWAQQRLGRWVRGTFWTLTQALITIFFLFYLFRDQEQAVGTLRSLLPLSDKESDELLDRVRAMIHATIYGTVVVAMVQGALGGLMFWILGLPGALLWGVIMGLLAIIPVLGAFVIWVPAALVLALQGSIGKAAILTAWGTVVVGLIDNLLYPVLVGKEMRLHTAPVFVSIVGGLFIFGASGLVLGPVVLATTVALLDILRKRTAGNRSAQEPT